MLVIHLVVFWTEQATTQSQLEEGAVDKKRHAFFTHYSDIKQTVVFWVWASVVLYNIKSKLQVGLLKNKNCAK